MLGHWDERQCSFDHAQSFGGGKVVAGTVQAPDERRSQRLQWPSVASDGGELLGSPLSRCRGMFRSHLNVDCWGLDLNEHVVTKDLRDFDATSRTSCAALVGVWRRRCLKHRGHGYLLLATLERDGSTNWSLRRDQRRYRCQDPTRSRRDLVWFGQCKLPMRDPGWSRKPPSECMRTRFVEEVRREGRERPSTGNGEMRAVASNALADLGRIGLLLR
jgi:hypothetical protein